MAAMDFIRSPATDPSGEACTSQRISAMDIAKLLLENFVAPPVTKMVFGDDESQCLRRVATTMTTEYNTIILPLKSFVASQMKMPLVYHEVVRESITMSLGLNLLSILLLTGCEPTTTILSYIAMCSTTMVYTDL